MKKQVSKQSASGQSSKGKQTQKAAAQMKQKPKVSTMPAPKQTLTRAQSKQASLSRKSSETSNKKKPAKKIVSNVVLQKAKSVNETQDKQQTLRKTRSVASEGAKSSATLSRAKSANSKKDPVVAKQVKKPAPSPVKKSEPVIMTQQQMPKIEIINEDEEQKKAPIPTIINTKPVVQYKPPQQQLQVVVRPNVPTITDLVAVKPDTQPPAPSYTLTNLVATADLNCRKLDLRKIYMGCRNAEYNPSKFPAVVMRIREPKTTALIFAKGKIVITGAKSEQWAMQAGKIFEKTIQKVLNGRPEQGQDELRPSENKATGLKVNLTGFKTQNMVASCDMKFSIKLEALLEELQKSSKCHYEPELFPGLIYKMEMPKVVLLIFTSGKINLAGAKTKEQIVEAFKKIGPVLYKYNKKKIEYERMKRLNEANTTMRSQPRMISGVAPRHPANL